MDILGENNVYNWKYKEINSFQMTKDRSMNRFFSKYKYDIIHVLFVWFSFLDLLFNILLYLIVFFLLSIYRSTERETPLPEEEIVQFNNDDVVLDFCK